MSCAVCVESAPGFCDCGEPPVCCPACEGRTYTWIKGVGRVRCEHCDGYGTMCESDADSLAEHLENEAADFASLEASLVGLDERS